MRKEPFSSWDSVLLEDVDDLSEGIEWARLQTQGKLRRNPNTDPSLASGDLDAQWEMAESSGEETAGGSMMTPDQNVVDELGEAVGVTYDVDEELWCGDKERERDSHRWELDPASADDWEDRHRK
jgi:hypothetical protein